MKIIDQDKWVYRDVIRSYKNLAFKISDIKYNVVKEEAPVKCETTRRLLIKHANINSVALEIRGINYEEAYQEIIKVGGEIEHLDSSVVLGSIPIPSNTREFKPIVDDLISKGWELE
jgi:hypothetical protein